MDDGTVLAIASLIWTVLVVSLFNTVFVDRWIRRNNAFDAILSDWYRAEMFDLLTKLETLLYHGDALPEFLCDHLDRITDENGDPRDESVRKAKLALNGFADRLYHFRRRSWWPSSFRFLDHCQFLIWYPGIDRFIRYRIPPDFALLWLRIAEPLNYIWHMKRRRKFDWAQTQGKVWDKFLRHYDLAEERPACYVHRHPRSMIMHWLVGKRVLSQIRNANGRFGWFYSHHVKGGYYNVDECSVLEVTPNAPDRDPIT